MPRIRHARQANLARARRFEPVPKRTEPKRRGPKSSPIDPDALTAALAELAEKEQSYRDARASAVAEAAAEVTDPEPTTTPKPRRRVAGPYDLTLPGNQLPAIGRCHVCDKPVTGERRFCGRCITKRKL